MNNLVECIWLASNIRLADAKKIRCYKISNLEFKDPMHVSLSITLETFKFLTWFVALVGTIDAGIRGANLCWALGGIICNFTPILPYFQHWGDKPRPRFFSGKQIKWRPKKKVFTKNWTVFSPNSSGDLRSDANQSHIRGGDANVDHTQIIGGIQSNYWGDISPPPGFRHSWLAFPVADSRGTDQSRFKP